MRRSDALQLGGGTLLALLFVEMALRAVGPGTWTPFASFDAVPVMTRADPELGWVNAPGDYRWEVDGQTVSVHVSPDGRRGSQHGDVGLFGGSFVFGYGLSDPDVLGATAGWSNHGVPGYGTLQALGLYERLETPPRHVVYGLVDLHDGRNAAAWSWLYALDRSGPDQPWVAAPAAWWDGSALVRSPPIRYAHWPLSERVAFVHLLERLRIAVHDRFLRTKAETTIQLVLRFRDAVRADGGRFTVALLHAPDRSTHYIRRLDEERVAWVDLRHPRFPEWSIPGDGHPDARVHADWTARLREVL